MFSGSLMQEMHVVHVGTSGFVASYADYTTGNPATDVVNMSKWDEALFLVVKGSGAVGTATITVEACSNTTPSATQAIVFDYWTCTSVDTWSDMSTATAAGFTTTAGADQVYAIRVKAIDLYSTYKYVRLQFTEVDSTACDGTVICILTKGRYIHEVPATALT